jgi:ABC-2 type transport system ATP-binding protein
MRGRGRRATAARVVALALVAMGLAATPALARDAVVTSFDGTRISLHLLPAAGLAPGHRAPTVLMGPGWGGKGITDPEAPSAPGLGVVGVGPLRHAGYNVLTWDPRGFGASGGLAEIDSARFEARDTSALITWLARQPEARLDRAGDPRVGMAGASYGGGIQLTTAATDRRVDAIVPAIAWHSQATSLYKASTVKTGWAQLLVLAATIAGQRNDPEIGKANSQGLESNVLSPDVVRYFRTRGPDQLVARIRAPTLLFQGTVDTLFTLQEGVTNYGILRADHVPVKMVWFCGGHGACLTNPGDTSRVQRDSLRWLARYLKGDRATRTGSGFEWVDQRGHNYAAGHFPVAPGPVLKESGRGRLHIVSPGGSGPYPGPFPPNGGLGAFVAPAVAAKAKNAVNVRWKLRRAATILGAPSLTLTYHGLADRVPARVLAQIVDNATGKVLGNQITPIPLVLDGQSRTIRVPLEIVTATGHRGSGFTLQLVAQSSLYNTHPAGGSVAFSRIALSLPTVRTD